MSTEQNNEQAQQTTQDTKPEISGKELLGSLAERFSGQCQCCQKMDADNREDWFGLEFDFCVSCNNEIKLFFMMDEGQAKLNFAFKSCEISWQHIHEVTKNHGDDLLMLMDKIEKAKVKQIRKLVSLCDGIRARCRAGVDG